VLNNPTAEKMLTLRLPAMAEAFQAQLGRPEFAGLDFAERVGLMVDAEWTAREQRGQRRRLAAAKLRHQACLEDIDWTAPRGLDRSVILSLGTCSFIHDHRNLLITGSTGVGKSFLACAYAERACRSGYSAYYVRAPRLYHELAVSRADGSYGRLLQKLTRTDLLVIDDWGLAPLKEPERRELLELVEDRHQNASTLITSQLPVKAWYEAIGDPTLADAICDRLIPGAYKVHMKGPSMRQEKARSAGERTTPETG
jgi:DNA replication protein DnaC